MSIYDELIAKVKVLSDCLWDRRAKEGDIIAWLDNFVPTGPAGSPDERLHALYLLSQFMYFGNRQVRELMKVLYRDLFRYPLVAQIRKAHNDSLDATFIESEFRNELNKTLFLGIGNPSESGSHLLYYFRQENGLPKTRFIHSHEIFQRQKPTLWQTICAIFTNRLDRIPGSFAFRQPDITRYVFIDDFCGSGSQGQYYSKDIVADVKSLNPSVEVLYFVLFATSKGMEQLRRTTHFDRVECIFELDESFKCFSPSSRYFPSHIPDVTKAFAHAMCEKYGDIIFPDGPLGFGNCQLLIGFHHNTPDNTLPIFWFDERGGPPWSPIFKRYQKLYV